MPKPTKTLKITIKPDVHRALKIKAAKEGKSLQDIVDSILREEIITKHK